MRCLKVAHIEYQLRWHKSYMVRQAIAVDHNDCTARPGNGIQIMHANRHLHIESMPCDIDIASIFASGQANEMDNNPISDAHKLLEWTAIGLSIP